MRIPLTLVGAALVAITVSACSSEPATTLSVPGGNGGLYTNITGVVRDTAGYTLQVQVTNQNGVVVSPDYCSWQVEIFGESGWTLLADAGDCAGVGLGLNPGASMTFAFPFRTASALTLGTELRATIGWGRGNNQLSTSDPVTIK
jgi:hypothetical protein